MSPVRVGMLVLLSSFKQFLGEEFLPPPDHVKLVSKDFNLFLTWMPANNYPPGVLYTVQWNNPFDLQWSNLSHCTSISKNVCNITCASPELHNRFQVRVKALLGTTGKSSEWVESEMIDYSLHVKFAPPILQVSKTENEMVVNATVSYPSCLQPVLQDLWYSLTFEEVGVEKKQYRKVLKEVVNFDVRVLKNGNYCFSAQTFLLEEEQLYSNFSKPICMLLHDDKAKKWMFLIALPLLSLACFLTRAIVAFRQYKDIMKRTKTPQALDFSNCHYPKTLLLKCTCESVRMNVLVCTAEPVTAGRRRRVASSLSEDDEDEDESGGPTPYTEMLHFQRIGANCQMVGTGQKAPDSSSESGSSQQDQGSLPDLMASGGFILTQRDTEEASSVFQQSEGTSLSEGSLAEDPFVFQGQEVADVEIDLLTASVIGPDSTTLIAEQFGITRDFPEAKDQQISLLGVQDNEDSGDLLLDERSFGNNSSDHGRPAQATSILKVSSREGLNRDSGWDNLPEPKFHSYRLKHMNYISRT